MRQASLKLYRYIKSVDVINNNVETIAFKGIMVSFGGLALLYVLFLGNMVANIVERRSLEAEARTLESVVGNLELTYLAMSNDVDLSLSYSLGFEDRKPIFANRKSLGLGGLGSGNAKIVQNDIQ